MSKTNRSNFKLRTDLLGLRSFLAIAEEGGFLAATKRINHTQSAICLQIAKLEERLDTKLLKQRLDSVG